MAQQTEQKEDSPVYPVIVKDGEFDKNSIQIEIMDKDCVLIRNALGSIEQFKMFEDIIDRDKSPRNAPKAMYPSPKTLIFGDDNVPTLNFKPDDKSLYNQMIRNANDIIQRNYSEMGAELKKKYKSIVLGTIQYPSPNGYFAEHIDHSNSFVYLMSIGCDANFMVKGPNMVKKSVFAFKSGDLLVFNASTKAQVLHGVMSIGDTSTCPEELAKTFEILRIHRYGIQCRVHF